MPASRATIVALPPALFFLATCAAGCFSSNNKSGAPSTTFSFDGGLDATFAADARSGDGAAGDGGVESGATFEGGVDAAPVVFDAGTGCEPTGDQSPLSASAEGLPTAGLALWLRADHGVYTTSSDAGSAVCAWADVAGDGWLLENQSATQPTFSATAIGNQPALHFGATTTPLLVSSLLGIGPTSPRTLIAVEALVNADGRFEPIVQGELGTAGTYIAIDANTYGTAGNREGVYMTSNAFDTTAATAVSQAKVHVYTVSAMTVGTPVTSSIDYRVNGVAQTFTLLPGGSDGTFQDFSSATATWVGPDGFGSTTGVPADGYVAEVLVYNRALTVAERATVESVLEARYSIP